MDFNMHLKISNYFTTKNYDYINTFYVLIKSFQENRLFVRFMKKRKNAKISLFATHFCLLIHATKHVGFYETHEQTEYGDVHVNFLIF
jgi:hypothetical protein